VELEVVVKVAEQTLMLVLLELLILVVEEVAVQT
jgi:hypothetical protein